MPDTTMPTLFPLSDAQTEIWLGQIFDPANTCYNIARYVEIFGAVDPIIFETALRQTVDEIDSLRIIFADTENGPKQYLNPCAGFDVPFIDVSGENDPRAAAVAWMRDDMNRAFDLMQGPLFRYALFKAAEDRFFWYEANHHLVIDAVGASLIERRVAERYRALAEGAICDAEPPSSWLHLLDEAETYRRSERRERDRSLLAGAARGPARCGHPFGPDAELAGRAYRDGRRHSPTRRACSSKSSAQRRVRAWRR